MGVAAILLLVVNIVYATSPVVTRLVLDDVPPITLALLRLVLGAAVLVPFGRGARATPVGQGARVFWMGALGFAAAFALSHWGIARSSATNARCPSARAQRPRQSRERPSRTRVRPAPPASRARRGRTGPALRRRGRAAGGPT